MLRSVPVAVALSRLLIHFCTPYLADDRERKTMVITILLKSVLSATFPPPPPPHTHTHTHSPISNLPLPPCFPPPPILIIIPLRYLLSLIPPFPPSPPFSVCKGPLLSSLRRALIRSATLNKGGRRTEGERGSGGGEGESDTGRQSGGGGRDVRVSINRPREGLRGGPRLG